MQDEDLIKRLCAGDTGALELIMDSYNKLLWMIAGGILNNVGTPEDVEECISDVYIKLWNNPKAFNPKKGSLKTFLAVIAKTGALDKFRQLTKAKFTELNDAVHSSNDDLLDFVLDKEANERLYQAVKTLGDLDKEIVVRRYYFDEKPSFIADKTAVPIKEVENRLYQSKLRLKKILTGTGVLHHE